MQSDIAIYEPPSDGFPFLVVTFAAEGIDVAAANSRMEARTIASEKRIRRRQRKRPEQI
jgi:hypothetical protein